jgi:uncharacterized DUF497 family protein
MLFEWDPKKAAANLRKHGVDFDMARTVFADPDRIEAFSRLAAGEERFVSIGTAADGNILTIAFTWRIHEDQTKRCRIISARKAHRHERSRYPAVH